MEEQEEQCDLNPLWGEKVCVARAIALKEPVPLEFAQIAAKLVEAVSIGGELVRTASWISRAVQPPT